MDFLIYFISFLFGVGILCFFWLFSVFTNVAAERSSAETVVEHDFAKMLHEEGIRSVSGERIVRTRGVTFQLTTPEAEVFFDALPDSIIQLLRISGTAHVLYLGRARGDNPTAYPIFNIVCAGSEGTFIDITPFSPSATTVCEIAQKYDKLVEEGVSQ